MPGAGLWAPAAGDGNLEIDFVDGGGPSGEDIAYRGEAPPGTAVSAAAWKISRYLFPTANPDNVSRTWAGGNHFADKVWNDRASLTYS